MNNDKMNGNDFDFLKRLEEICKEYDGKRDFLELFRKSDLFTKEPIYRYDFNITVFTLHNKLEDIFDRIIRVYTRPKQKDEDLYEDEIMNALKITNSPEAIRERVIFYLGFNEKKLRIYDIFSLSQKARNAIDKLSVVRNSIAHRYCEDDERFKYFKKNIFHNSGSMATFLVHCITAMEEVLSWETRLLDAIDKAEKDLK